MGQRFFRVISMYSDGTTLKKSFNYEENPGLINAIPKNISTINHYSDTTKIVPATLN